MAANSNVEGISNKFDLRLQHSHASRQAFCHPATIPRDENLKANLRRRRKTQGGTEATNRRLLEHSADVIQSTVVFIAVTAASRMVRQVNCNPLKTSERRKVNPVTGSDLLVVIILASA